MRRPDIGLYQAKFAARRLLDRLPGIERLEPNAVSVASIVPSAVAAVALANGWWLVVIVGIIGRMVLTTLDGHIAENYGKATRVGAYVNRVPAEIGDAMILLALFARAEALWVGLVLAGAWLVNVLGVLALVAGGSTQSVGPAGQTDRLALLIVASAIAALTPVDWTIVCQLLVALMALTIALRIARSVRELTRSP
jgi:CDP-diacylglycerol--glycerol-3-phosphate 3-phosphatidyltransferase